MRPLPNRMPAMAPGITTAPAMGGGGGGAQLGVRKEGVE